MRVVYGLSGYVGGSFFNIDLADTTTTAGRSVIAVSALTIECLYGWYKFYEFGAHMKLINIVAESNCDEICSRFTLRDVTTDEILENMLGRYYQEGYYRESSLRARIDKMTNNQRKVLFIKNNIREFYKIPEVKELLRQIILIIKEDNMCIKLDNGATLMSPFTHKPSKDLIEKLSGWVRELPFGMYYYDGDYVEREYQETMVDIVSNMKRWKISNMDTDSAVTTVYHDKVILLDMFKEEIGDKVNDFIFVEGTLPMLLMTVYLSAVKETLKLYGASINIDPDLIKLIDLEAEIIMEQEHLSISKKNYTFTTMVKDFILKVGKMDSRGFKFKKSDANADIAEQVENDIKNMIMCHVQDIKFKDIIEHVHKVTNDTVNIIKTDDFIINKKSLAKIGDVDDISWGDTRMKAIRLWDKLYPETPVEIPGSFGIIRIALDEEVLSDFMYNHPREYKIMLEHSKEMKKYTTQNRVISKVTKIMDEEDEDNFDIMNQIRVFPEELKAVLRKICKKIDGNYSDRDANDGLYDEILDIVKKEQLSETNEKNFLKWLGFTSSKADDFKLIISSIDRIAVPIDINTVPDIFKENNYRLLDIEAASEYEHLLSPVLNTTSLVVVKNKSKNSVLTSALQVF